MRWGHAPYAQALPRGRTHRFLLINHLQRAGGTRCLASEYRQTACAPGEPTELGPRPASNAEVAALTVQYLERQLDEIGVTTQREVFALTPNAKLMLYTESETGALEQVEVPGVYFARNITQARVVHGLVQSLGLESSFSGYGIEYGESPPIEQINLIATIPGVQTPGVVLELSAHHDTVTGTVGGDNTSGVAALLEVARLLQMNPPACTVRLCFFAAEEIGLLGSQEHVRILKEEKRLQHVIGLINLDAVGHFTDEPQSQTTRTRIPFVVWPPSTGNFLTIIGANGSAKLAHLVEDAGELYAPDLPVYTLAKLGGFMPDARRSDHAHYWDHDIPAVFLTDTGEFRSDHYHRPSDSLEHVDCAALREVVRLAYASAVSVKGSLK